MDVVITNSADLKFEMERLKGIKAEQESAIKKHFNSPRAILGTITSLFYKPKNGDGSSVLDLRKYDIGNLISKYLLPLALNKTLFRKSNFIVKSIVGLVSSRVGGLLNDGRVAHFWDKIKPHLPAALVEKQSPKKRHSVFSFLSSKKQKRIG